MLRLASRPLVDLFGNTRARDFSPRKLKDVREAMIKAGWVRSSINRQIGRIKRMLKWAVVEELLPVEVYTTVGRVDGLRAGRSRAKEAPPVKPVDESHVEVIRPHVSRQVWAMIQLQLLPGMRPGDVTSNGGSASAFGFDSAVGSVTANSGIASMATLGTASRPFGVAGSEGAFAYSYSDYTGSVSSTNGTAILVTHGNFSAGVSVSSTNDDAMVIAACDIRGSVSAPNGSALTVALGSI